MTPPPPGNGRIVAAQSVVLLFEQLRLQGYDEPALQRVRLAYGWAMAMFAGRMHASGKPYIAHGVAAASVLAAGGASADVVIAGLLHGAYRWGDFGPARVLLPLKRRWLRRRVGERVEEFVHGFYALPWNPEAIRALGERLPNLGAVERTAVWMRLASDLDNGSDRALQYCADAERRLESTRRKLPLLIGLAQGLGSPALADALRSIDDPRAPVPPDLRWPHPTATLMPPESARRTPEARIGAAAGRFLRRLRRL